MDKIHKSDYQVKIEKENETKAKKQARNKAALPCLSKDIFRMEQVAKNLISRLDVNVILEDAAKVAGEVLEQKISIQPTEWDIKKLVAIGSIRTTCDSDFSFLVNINATGGEKLDTLRMWSQNPPFGYEDGQLQDFSVNFSEIRKEQKIEEQQRAVIAAAKTRAEEQQRAVIAAAKASIEDTTNAATETKGIDLFDHCAPDINRKERLRRLAVKGTLKQTSGETYVVSEDPNKYRLSFFYRDKLRSCK